MFTTIRRTFGTAVLSFKRDPLKNEWTSGRSRQGKMETPQEEGRHASDRDLRLASASEWQQERFSTH